MTPKVKKTKQTIIITALIILFVIFYSLHISHAMAISVEKKTTVETTDEVKSVKDLTTGGETLAPVTTNDDNGQTNILTIMPTALENMLEHPFDLNPIGNNFWPPFVVLTVITLLIAGYIYTKAEFEHTDAFGKEEGSAKWNDNIPGYKKEFETVYNPKTDPFDRNLILAKDLYLLNDNKKIKRNLNACIVGGPGTGKSFGLIKPNMAQMNSSAIITDPKGELFACMEKPLLDRGIRVKLFSTSDMVHSNCYNPFDYVYDENGDIDETRVSTMVHIFLQSASAMGESKKSSGDPFWDKSANAFISACCYYLLESDLIAKEEINFSKVFALVSMAKSDEDNESSQTQLDLLMSAHKKSYEQQGKVSKAASMYFDIFKLAPSKTANSILISCQVDLKMFNQDKVKNLTRTDYLNPRNNVQLDTLGDEQTYLFINIPAADSTFNFLVTLLYSQMFNVLFKKAEKIYPEKYMLLDKFGNPVKTLLNSPEEAEKCKTWLKEGKISEVKTVNGGIYYQIKRGKNIIVESTNKEKIEKIKAEADTYTVKRGGIRMPWHIRCLMDEFANIANIPDFEKYMGVIRSYEISCWIVLQSLAQLKQKYDKNWETLIATCDTFICLGVTDNETSEYVSKKLGDTTIRVKSTSFSRKSGTSQSYSNKKRPLMTPDEVRMINENNKNQCIVIINNIRPFLAKKYSFLEHPNFKLTGDASDENRLTQKENEKYFFSTPIDITKIKTKKKRQKSLLETAGKSIFNRGSSIRDDLKNQKIDEENIDKDVTAKEPTEENKENQTNEVNGTAPKITVEDITNNDYVPDSQVYGVSSDSSDNAFYF